MVKGALVDRFVAAGRKLVELLDTAQLDIKSAIWLYRAESEDWVLLLAVPGAERQGPRLVYERIYDVFVGNLDDLKPLSFEDVVVMSPDEPLPQLFRRALHTGPGISEIRFSGNRIDSTLIEDALIYRST